MKQPADYLASMTLAQLQLAADRLHMGEDAYELDKAHLAAAISAALPGKMHYVLRCAGLPFIATIEHLWGDLHYRPDEVLPAVKVKDDPDFERALHTLRDFGLAWRTRRGWELHTSVHSAIASLTKQDERTLYEQELLRQFVIAQLNFYGLVSEEYLLAQLRLVKPAFTREQLADLMLTSFDLQQVAIHDEETDTLYYAHPMLEDPFGLIDQNDVNLPAAYAAYLHRLRAKHTPNPQSPHKDFPYAPYRPQDALLAGDGLPGPYAAYEEAIQWCVQNGASCEDAMIILQNALYPLQNGGTQNDFTQEILDPFDLDPELLSSKEKRIFRRLAENVPLWQLHGATAHSTHNA